MTKYILVAGGCGFIGINLVKKLIQDRHNHVTVIDNLITGNRVHIDSLLKEYVNLYFVHGDINNTYELAQLPFSFDEIYHLASIASPYWYQKHPLETLDTGYTGTKNLLELARKHKARILFASTSEIYGQPQVSPQAETYNGNVNCVGTRSCYDESKRIGETLMYTYNKLYNVQTRIARIFNTYGPYMSLDDGRLLPNIMNNVTNDDDMLIIYGDGSQTRCFTYIDDTLEGLTRLIASDYTDPVNIGSDVEISINDLIALMRKKYNFARIDYQPIDPDDPLVRKPDISLAKEILNWQPTTDLMDGLNSLHQYWTDCQTHLKNKLNNLNQNSSDLNIDQM